jgi:hypothetical protein
LEELNLRKVNILGDGNCFFRALTVGIADADQNSFRQLLADNVSELRKQEKYSHFFENGVNSWVENIGRDGNWNFDALLYLL